MIGIIIAMNEELNPYIPHIDRTERIRGKDFYSGKIGNSDIVICLSGIGKVNAAFAATLMVERFEPELIINTGVSGGLGIMKPYDIVVAEKVVQHDVDLSALGDPKGKVSTVNKIFFDTSRKNNEKFLNIVKGAKIGVLACGDQFIADKKLSKKITDDFGAIACDMESGAIAQIAHITKTELVVIRGISDGADEKASIDFPELVKSVSEIIYKSVKKLLYDYK